jgi:two-component system, OmpR family, response regulator
MPAPRGCPVRILVVEDHHEMAELIEQRLREEAFSVDVAPTGEDGVFLAVEYDFDAIVLDVLLPGIDGFETCRRIRDAGRWAPILMLTARDAVADRVRGLDFGADDYLVKPFSFSELLARLRALIRRGSSERPPTISVGDLTLDPSSHEVHRDGTAIELTAKEFALLEYFLRHPGEALTRSRLLEHVWDFAYDGDSNVVDVFVRQLRDKVDRPFGASSIETIRGVGYRFRDEDP